MFSEQTEGTESFIGVWLKRLGERVNANEPIVEISTDKVSMEIPAPASGVLAEILKTENEPVAPGEILGHIEAVEASSMDDRAPKANEPQEASSSAPAQDGLSPAVRKLIQDNHLDPNSIPGTGRGGRLTYQDVIDFLSKQQSAAKRTSRMVPHTPMRRAIAGHMLRSVQSSPHVTAVFEADMSPVIADRESFKTRAQEVPSVTAYLIHAAVQALKAVPEVNSRWHENALEIFEDINIGIGTATPDGRLIVPVIHSAQDLSLLEIAARLRELIRKAREGALTTEEIRNGTFTISNHGVSGSLLAAPILIHDSQSAILGAGKLQKRPVVIERDGNDVVQVKPMMYVT